MSRARRIRPCLIGSLSAAVFLLSWELATQSSFYLLELSLGLLAISLAAFLLDAGPARWPALARNALLMGKPGVWVVSSVLLYLLVDAAVALYSPSPPLMLQKYRLVAVVLLVAGGILLLGDDPTAGRAVRWSVALSSPAVCLMAVLNQFVFRVYPIYYTRRLSLRADYNMFATVVFTGMTIGFFTALERGATRRAKLMGALFFLLPAVCVISRSASRRIVIALIPTLTVMLWAAWSTLAPRKPAGRLRAAAIVCLAALCVWTGDWALERGMRSLQQSGIAPSDLSGGSGETTAAERYATVADGSLLTKRRVIWGVALAELSRYRPVELLRGRGGGANIILYDGVGEPLDAVYPDRDKRMGALSAHNLLLADLLDGGLVKLLSGLPMLAVLFWLSLRYTLRRPLQGLPVAVALTLCLLNSMISNRFGLLYDRYFAIFVALLAVGVSQSDCPAARRRRDAR